MLNYIFIGIGLLTLELISGNLNYASGVGGNLAMAAIAGFILFILSILNVIFNIGLYCTNDKKIKWENFPNKFNDYLYLYFFGFFHLIIGKRLGWFIFALPLIFIWSFVAITLLVLPLELLATILYNL